MNLFFNYFFHQLSQVPSYFSPSIPKLVICSLSMLLNCYVSGQGWGGVTACVAHRILQCTAQPPTVRITQPKTSIVLRLRNPVMKR